ncbi:MAG: 2-dehydropantoate 2-reductase [Desulfarculaceae bacterium]|jgi:2-dehydropantoate 2-reductase
MHITVVGPGALGTLWAIRLAQSGAWVNILDHRPERAALLSRQGFIVEDGEGVAELALDIGSEPDQTLKDCQLALVCVKAYNTEEVAAILGRHLPDSAKALTLQNGIGNVEALSRTLGPERVLGGITSEGATLLEPGRVRHAGRGQTRLGPAQGQLDGFAYEIEELFSQAGFASQTAEQVQNLIWTKLVINVGINALTAILDIPNGHLLKLPGALKIMSQAVAEAVQVGRALGIEFPQTDMLPAVKEVAQGTSRNISSMLQDVRNHRRTEVDFINSAVARLGAEQGIPTPVNQNLTRLVWALEQMERLDRG